jgi:hypothetical protein
MVKLFLTWVHAWDRSLFGVVEIVVEVENNYGLGIRKSCKLLAQGQYL